MTTLIAIRPLTSIRTCTVCQQPSTEEQGLVLEMGGYIHPNCSERNYQLVTVVSFPGDDLDPEPDPTTPTPAALVSGPELCDDCKGLCYPFYPDELCDTCQKAMNDWDSCQWQDSDYDLHFERVVSARDYLLIAA